MICRITEMMMENNIKFNHSKWKIRASECKNPECCNGVCNNFSVVDKKLTTSVYGWTLFELIYLDRLEEIKKVCVLCNCDRALRIIHPSKSNIWICRTKNQEEGKPPYIVMSEGTIKYYNSIGEMNFKIKEDFSFDNAREIFNEDFEDDSSH